MKHIAIQKIFSYFFTSQKEVQNDACGEKIDKFYDDLRELCKKHDIQLSESYTSFYGMEKFSIQECEQCKKIMLNRDKNPAGFDEYEATQELNWVVLDGGEFEGRILCEECLPVSHRWGHSS